ncbi:hypothetical protein L2E82_00818 [Cichorium intybus]|uniref:Uncharacterized protein n=1 Tax=Cichorium intybus TaxID=13427 RepID=A0ACB9GYT5_CICIN|nr:hypothetical protein L2E82_00818 [Cichorium intybus]
MRLFQPNLAHSMLLSSTIHFNDKIMLLVLHSEVTINTTSTILISSSNLFSKRKWSQRNMHKTSYHLRCSNQLRGMSVAHLKYSTHQPTTPRHHSGHSPAGGAGRSRQRTSQKRNHRRIPTLILAFPPLNQAECQLMRLSHGWPSKILTRMKSRQ